MLIQYIVTCVDTVLKSMCGYSNIVTCVETVHNNMLDIVDCNYLDIENSNMYGYNS